MTEAQVEVVQDKKHLPIGGDPHPDVFVEEGVLRNLKEGEVATKQQLAAAIGMTLADWPIVYQRITTARNRLRKREGINICCVRGKGYMKEPGLSATTRVLDGERKSLRRRADKNIQTLFNVKEEDLDNDDQRYKLRAGMVIMQVTKMVNTHTSQQKILAAVKVSDVKRLPMANALKVLQNGGNDEAN